MPFIKLHTFQSIRHHPETVLYTARKGSRPPNKYLPEIFLESFSIVSLIQVETYYQQFPEGYVPATISQSPSHPYPDYIKTYCTEIALRVRSEETELTYRVEETPEEILALIADAEYADKLRWHKQAKKARDIVGR